MSVGSVLSEAWELYKRFFGRFVATAALVFVALDLVGAIARMSGDSFVAVVFWTLVSIVLGIVGTFWVQGALVEAVRDVRDGRVDTTIGELYSRTAPRLPALIAAGIVAGIAVAFGLVLLIVPGLFLLTRWSMIVPVIVLEGRGAGDSFSRSWELVRGHGWPVFGVIVITVIGSGIANGIIEALFVFLPDFFQSWIGGLIADSLTTPFVALAWTVMYYRLSAPAERPLEPAAA